LFRSDEGEIKKDVIDNVKSSDGTALVARIEEAMMTGSWNDARETWEYIKSRRKQLRNDLTESEKEVLQDFIVGKRAERIYLLMRGSLEAYLPIGYRDKNIDKLNTLIASENFWSKLPVEAQQELAEIARLLMPDTQLPTSA
jgi:putative ATP-dependent endonuclease of OLD family